MKLTDALLGEHGALYSLMAHVEEVARLAKNPNEIISALSALANVLVSHARIEEEQLFPPLAQKLGPSGPISVMQMEHEDIEHIIAEIPRLTDLEQIKRKIADLMELTRGHFMKEEEVLFMMARELLGESTLEDLGRRWSDVRGVQVR